MSFGLFINWLYNKKNWIVQIGYNLYDSVLSVLIEYYLITVQIIKDIIRQNFKKQYIVEFAETLLSKPKKILGILNIIDNSAIQDKISLKVRYEYYLDIVF